MRAQSRFSDSARTHALLPRSRSQHTKRSPMADIPRCAETSPSCVFQPLTQIVCRAYVDLVRFVDCAQHIGVAKSPPTPRLRRATFAPPISIFGPLHNSKAGLPAETLPLGGAEAGEGNRTLVSSLGSWRSTIELHPHQTSPTSGLAGDYLRSCSKRRLSS